jgi:hypothetical protein
VNYQLFVEAQRHALASEFKNQMSMCLMATTAEHLISHARGYRWAIHRLEGVNPTSALIVQKPQRPPELWVGRKYRKYRRAFERYLCQCFDGNRQRLPREWEVDHLQSIYRFKVEHPHYFVRLALVPRATNASYGAGFEKLFYSRERNTTPIGGIHVNWIAFLKASGIRLPGKGAGTEAWQLWAWRISEKLEKDGIENIVLAYLGISTVLNLGYTGTYAPLPLHPTFRSVALANSASACYSQWADT